MWGEGGGKRREKKGSTSFGHENDVGWGAGKGERGVGCGCEGMDGGGWGRMGKE